MTQTPVSREMALNAQVVDFRAATNGRDYRLLISVPARPAPPGGHPVLYLIDGNLHFGIAVDTARIQARWPDVRDPVIVGIGYATDSVVTALTVRMMDLTTPTTPEWISRGWMAKMPTKLEEVGGMDAYLQMIDAEVKPRVAGIVPIDAGDQTLMGHSLGGLTTLHALLRRTASFQQFVAISPSIWWDDSAVLQHEAAFAAAARAGRVQARALVSVGGLESTPRQVPPGMPMTQADAEAMNEGTRMVANAAELAARLAALKAPGLHVEGLVHDGDDHNMVPAAGIARGIRFSMRR